MIIMRHKVSFPLELIVGAVTLMVIVSGLFAEPALGSWESQSGARVKDYRTRPPSRLCDAIGESTEECEENQELLRSNDVDPQLSEKVPKFLLYKKDNNTGAWKYVTLTKDVEQIRRDGEPVEGGVWKILIHGFLNNASSPFPVNVRDAYVTRMEETNYRAEYNILVVDWGTQACASVSSAGSYLYDYAAKNTANVGMEVGSFLVYMHKNGLMDVAKDAHIIGFSLGAHVAGQAGRKVFDDLGITVRRITGLDPAGPAFWAWKFLPDFIIPRERLHRKHSQFADIYHTSAVFGSEKQMGDIDFRINGGKSQPNCLPKILKWLPLRDYMQICSHNFVTFLYAKSISDNSVHGCECPSYRSYIWGTCTCQEQAVFGEYVDNTTVTVGEFFVTTPWKETSSTLLDTIRNFSISSMIQQLQAMICK